MVKKGLLVSDFLGITAFPNGLPIFRSWWEWTLVAIIAVSVAVGLFACLWYSYRSIRGLLRVRHVNEILLHLTDE
jgi:H+/Cl- antiporter ClcA